MTVISYSLLYIAFYVIYKDGDLFTYFCQTLPVAKLWFLVIGAVGTAITFVLWIIAICMKRKYLVQLFYRYWLGLPFVTLFYYMSADALIKSTNAAHGFSEMSLNMVALSVLLLFFGYRIQSGISKMSREDLKNDTDSRTARLD